MEVTWIPVILFVDERPSCSSICSKDGTIQVPPKLLHILHSGGMRNSGDRKTNFNDKQTQRLDTRWFGGGNAFLPSRVRIRYIFSLNYDASSYDSRLLITINGLSARVLEQSFCFFQETKVLSFLQDWKEYLFILLFSRRNYWIFLT